MSVGQLERNALLTAAVAFASGLAWYVFVTTPLPKQWSIQEAWLVGLGGAVIAGALGRAASASFAPVAGGTGLGILLASAFVQGTLSDISISPWQALWAGLTQMFAYQIGVWSAAMAGWIGVHLTLRVRRRTS